MQDKVLIVTSRDDEHADYIIQKCNGMGLGEQIIRLNTEDFITNVETWFDGEEFTVKIKDSGRCFEAKELKTVWYRRPVKVKTTYEDKGVDRFVVSQAETFLQGLYYCTHDSALWVNDLRANQFAKNKLFQLKVAKQVGFRVPKALITNSAEAALSFAKQEKKLCNKSLTVPRYSLGGNEYPYMTRIIDGLEEIEKYKESIKSCPAFFEEYIPKKVDVRVVAFGKKLFPFAIHSQEFELSSVDVRGMEPSLIKHELIQLPKDVEEKVVQFMKTQNLFFSSMDFVLSEDDTYYFIENNCNGQWLWLEYLTGVDMSGEFINALFGKTV